MDKTVLLYAGVVLLTETAKVIVDVWKERRNNPPPPKRRPSDDEVEAKRDSDDGEDRAA